MNYVKHMILLLPFFLTSSTECESCINIIYGEILNAYTNEPISEVEVQILENGLETKTDASGNFHLELGNMNLDNIVKIPLSFVHENYKPLEVNACFDSKKQYKMVPDTGKLYIYNQPVQLSDGILTGTMDGELDDHFIQDLMNDIYSNVYSEIHSILVYKNNKLVLEEYFYGNNDTIQFENGVKVDKTSEHIQWSRKKKHYIASVNKALTSTLIGIALDLSGVSIKDKISPYLPHYSSHFIDKKKVLIDFEDCLNMTAGFEWDEWEGNDLQLLWKSDDFTDFVLSKPNMGTDVEWRYNSALPNLLLKALEELTGSSSVRSWAYDNLYQKLGISDYKWQSQPDGFPEGAARMYMRPRDMLKIGATYLNGGVWNKKQVIPKSWVDDCFTVNEKTSSGNYSNYFWHRELGGVKYLSADGDGGNYINIFPEQNMVIVITQGNYLQWPFYMNQANSIMENYIIPAVK
jgi:antitoxin component YwqK of YwqJK toxin-antitoxin module